MPPQIPTARNHLRISFILGITSGAATRFNRSTQKSLKLARFVAANLFALQTYPGDDLSIASATEEHHASGEDVKV